VPGGLGGALDLQPVGDVVDHLAVRQQAEVLEDHADLVAADLAEPGGGGAADVLAADPDLARAGLDQPGEAAYERGLAAAGQAHDHEDLARTHLEAHVSDGGGAAGLLSQCGLVEMPVLAVQDFLRPGAEDLPKALNSDGRAVGRIPHPRLLL
jgi:hypothetical protein